MTSSTPPPESSVANAWKFPSFNDAYEGVKSFTAPRWNFTVATATHVVKTIARIVTSILVGLSDLVTLMKDETCHAASLSSFKELKYHAFSIPGSILGIMKPNWGEQYLPARNV